MNRVRLLLATALVLCWMTAAEGQDFGRGGRGDRGRDRGGDRGGFDRGGGDRGSGGGDRRTEFFTMMLQRMDANGNGLLEPSEVSERAKPFIDRAAGSLGIDLSQPIPLEKLVRRPEGETSPGSGLTQPNSAPPGATPPSGTPNAAQPNAGQPQAAAPQVQKPKPLVPGFGVQTAQSSVAGFGTPVSSPQLQPQSQPQQSTLAQNSPGDGRGGRRDERRSDNAGNSGGDAQAAASSDSRPQRRRFRTARERLPEGLPSWFSTTDKDADGQIMMHEWASAWTDKTAAEFARYDRNGDGVVTAVECLKVEPASQDDSSDDWGW